MALVSVQSAAYLREQRGRLAEQARHYKSEVTRNRQRLRDTMSRLASLDRMLAAMGEPGSTGEGPDPWPPPQ